MREGKNQEGWVWQQQTCIEYWLCSRSPSNPVETWLFDPIWQTLLMREGAQLLLCTGKQGLTSREEKLWSDSVTSKYSPALLSSQRDSKETEKGACLVWCRSPIRKRGPYTYMVRPQVWSYQSGMWAEIQSPFVLPPVKALVQVQLARLYPATLEVG